MQVNATAPTTDNLPLAYIFKQYDRVGREETDGGKAGRGETDRCQRIGFSEGKTETGGNLLHHRVSEMNKASFANVQTEFFLL